MAGGVNVTTASRHQSTTPPESSLVARFGVDNSGRQAMEIGALMALVVLGVSAMCFLVLLKWKMRDRQRLRPVEQHLTTQQHTQGTFTPHPAPRHTFRHVATCCILRQHDVGQ